VSPLCSAAIEDTGRDRCILPNIRFNCTHILKPLLKHLSNYITQSLKSELMAMFENHSDDVDAIELLLRRGIHVLGHFGQGHEEGVECDLFLTGKSSDMALCIRGSNTISESHIPCYDAQYSDGCHRGKTTVASQHVSIRPYFIYMSPYSFALFE
jgi:hypothetical protein